jgi:hypothetical protein
MFITKFTYQLAQAIEEALITLKVNLTGFKNRSDKWFLVFTGQHDSSNDTSRFEEWHRKYQYLLSAIAIYQYCESELSYPLL